MVWARVNPNKMARYPHFCLVRVLLQALLWGVHNELWWPECVPGSEFLRFLLIWIKVLSAKGQGSLCTFVFVLWKVSFNPFRVFLFYLFQAEIGRPPGARSLKGNFPFEGQPLLVSKPRPLIEYCLLLAVRQPKLWPTAWLAGDIRAYFTHAVSKANIYKSIIIKICIVPFRSGAEASHHRSVCVCRCLYPF